MKQETSCELCNHLGGVVLFANELFRIVRVHNDDYPAYLRIIVAEHVREMTDLPQASQQRVFEALIACERVLRRLCDTHKVNLASLGNMTPHVHWHVIGRYPDDATFPDAIWATPRRATSQPRTIPSDSDFVAALSHELSASAGSEDAQS